jgi:hypothetical protein
MYASSCDRDNLFEARPFHFVHANQVENCLAKINANRTDDHLLSPCCDLFLSAFSIAETSTAGQGRPSHYAEVRSSPAQVLRVRLSRRNVDASGTPFTFRLEGHAGGKLRSPKPRQRQS